MVEDHARILLVEDNDDHAELIRRGLGAHGIRDDALLRVTNGLDALDYLHHQGRFEDRADWTLPDLILLDLRLPKIGGSEVLRAIRESNRTNRIPVVILTSSDPETDKRMAHDLKATAICRSLSTLTSS